jgi:transcriptional regulator
MDIAKVEAYSFSVTKGVASRAHRVSVLQGTLDLMVLQTLDSMGSQHGYGIARRIEQVSEDLLKLNEGTVYTSLMRLQHEGWITSSWGVSENNRKAKFYAITKAGRRQLARETQDWERLSGVIARLLRAGESA